MGERRPGSVGLPLPGVSGELRGGETGDLSQDPTFLRATGGARRPRAKRSWTAGSRPAIIAERSPDGYYTLCGRRSDLIISGGFNIYPARD